VKVAAEEMEEGNEDQGGNLNLGLVHLYIHGMSQDLQSSRQYMRLCYGSIHKITNVFYNLKFCEFTMPDQKDKPNKIKLTGCLINAYTEFEYIKGNNFIKMQIFNKEDCQPSNLLGEALFTLAEMPVERFETKKLLFTNPKYYDDTSLWQTKLPKLLCSYFIEAIAVPKEDITEEFVVLQQFRKKQKETSDIFGGAVATSLEAKFKDLVSKELSMLTGLLGNSMRAQSIICEKYSYVDGKPMTENEFVKMGQLLLPTGMNSSSEMLKKVYKVMSDGLETESTGLLTMFTQS
jgi:hypothetical protein